MDGVFPDAILRTQLRLPWPLTQENQVRPDADESAKPHPQLLYVLYCDALLYTTLNVQKGRLLLSHEEQSRDSTQGHCQQRSMIGPEVGFSLLYT